MWTAWSSQPMAGPSSSLVSPGTLHVLDATTGHPRGLSGSESGAEEPSESVTNSPVSVTRSPSGRLLATVGPARPIEVWDAVTGELRGVLVAASGTSSAMFLSDSELVGISGDGAVHTYDLAVEDWIARACRIAGRELTSAEWDQFLPGYPYQDVCP